MQARKLKALLNNTEYTVAFYDKYIGIGSPLCHDLIRLNVEDGKLKYALDTWRTGREAVLHHKELTFIWDKLQDLVESGKMDEIINGRDEIENPLPVYTVRDGKLVSTFTDAYGWPNTTIDGYIMHDNDYFKTVGEAVEYGIKDYEYRVNNLTERIAEEEKEVKRLRRIKQEYSNIVAGLKLLNPAKGAVINTMYTDPKLQPASEQPANQEATEQAAGQEQANAQESASQDAAVGAGETE